MKKLSVLAFGLLFSASFFAVDTAEASTSSYWDFYRSYYSGENARSTGSRYNVPRYRARSYTNRSSRYNTNSTTRRTSNRYSNRSSNYRVYPTRSTTSRTNSSSALTATVTPIKLRQDINNITSNPVDLFQIGLRAPSASGSSFTPASQVSQMQFQVTDNTGVVSDFSDFDLVIEDQNFQFERNGYITLNFNNLRLAAGESRVLDVKIKLNDPDSFARLPGSFRVKMSGLTAVQENTVRGVNTNITGRTVSDYVVLNPVGSVSGGGANGSASVTPVFINGRALASEEKAVVLSARLKASRDDFLVEEITVRNTFGSNIDSLIQDVRLINQTTGKVLSTKRFTGGTATFNLSTQNQVYIARNNEVNLVFEVRVRSNIPSNIADNRIELTFNDADVDIFGIGSGREVPNSSKNFNVNAETFTVTEGGTGGTVARGGVSFSATQPSFVSNGTLDQIVRFQIRNSGSGSMSVGRLSLQAAPAGVEFTGGISTDDAQLVRVINGFQERPSGFVTSSASGNVFRFDAGSEVYIGPGEVQEYALKLKLDNTGSSDENDAVSVKILGDSSFTKGTLNSVRSSGANYVWSDHSGSPHSTTSSDWLSGFLVSGLPTNNFVKYRR